MPIIKKLRKVGSSVVSEIPLINHGGCCVYAAKVGKELEKLGYDVRVVFRKTGNVKKNNPEIKCPLLAEDWCRLLSRWFGCKVGWKVVHS